MASQFDIFRKEPEGRVLWCGTAASLEEAKAAVEKLAATEPGAFLIVDFHRRSEVTVLAGRAAQPDEPERVA
jgi:hypothetical protein